MIRTKESKEYTIDSHPDFQACFEKWQNREYREFFFVEDYLDSLRVFCDKYYATILDYSIGEDQQDVLISVQDWEDDGKYWDQPEMVGVRLWKFMGSIGMFRNLDGTCPFTGMCYDEILLDGIREFRDRPGLHTTAQDIIENCVEKWRDSLRKEFEYQSSEEYFREECDMYESWFSEDGTPV